MPLNNITSHSAQIVTHAISFIKSSFIVLTQEETQKTLLVSKPYLSLVLFFCGRNCPTTHTVPLRNEIPQFQEIQKQPTESPGRPAAFAPAGQIHSCLLY